MLTEFDLLVYAGLHRVSIPTAAHELDPDNTKAPIPLVISAIDLRRARGTGTKAGDYYDECLEAALNCAYVWT